MTDRTSSPAFNHGAASSATLGGSASTSAGAGGSGSSTRPTRLPSVKSSRDLTLGGVTKKTFVPNLNVERRSAADRNQNDLSESAYKTDTKQFRDRKDRGRQRDPSRRGGRGRGQPEVIQSHSIFAEGPQERLKQKFDSTPRLTGSRSNSSVSETKATVSVKQEKGVTVTDEALNDLLKDDFIDTGSGDDDDIQMIPVKLPLSSTGIKQENKNIIQPEMKIKIEKMEECSTSDEQQTMQDPPVSTLVAEAKPKLEPATAFDSMHDVFSAVMPSESEDVMLLMQLTDVLPGVPSSAAENQSEKADAEDAHAVASGSCLADFSDGYIGKLQIRRSGRVQLVLGHVTLDVFPGTQPGFLQDAVSVRLNDSNDGDLSVLGHVSKTFLCMPDMNSLLDLVPTNH